MKFSIRFADQIVGTLVILALAILVFVIFMLGRSQRWFTRDLLYKTYFNSASGLSNNMAIQYKGFTIGHVKKFELTENDNVEVTLSIFEEHSQRVKEGSLVEVSVSPIGLGNSFIFYPGRGPGLIDEGEEIPEKNSEKARQYIATGKVDIPESSDGINNILNNQLPAVLNDLNALLRTVNVSLAGSDGTDKPTLEQIVLNVESTTAGLTSLAQSLNDRISPILSDVHNITGELSEGSLSASITSTLESLAGVIENLDKTSAFIPAQLPQIGVLINEVNGALRTAQGVLTSIENNPLLKGGVPEHRETGPGAASPRNMEF